MTEQTTAQRKKAEATVEAGVKQVAEDVKEPIEEAAVAAAEAGGTVEEAAAKTEEVVQEQATKDSEKTGIPKAELVQIYREEVRDFLDRSHVAHGGENPPPVVAEAVAGAAGATAGHVARETVTTGATDAEGEAAPQEEKDTSPAKDAPPSKRPRDTRPHTGHWKDRPVFGRK